MFPNLLILPCAALAMVGICGDGVERAMNQQVEDNSTHLSLTLPFRMIFFLFQETLKKNLTVTESKLNQITWKIWKKIKMYFN